MKNILLFLFLLLVASCSLFKSSGYDKTMQNWVGQSEYALYDFWGQPSDVVYITPYEKVVTFIQTSSNGYDDIYSNELYYQGMGEDNGLWKKLFGPPAQQQANIYFCKTSFVIRNGVVIDYNFSGDDCN